MKRQVTEADFRMPQYRDAKPEDYEFRDDGQLVRKDRWELAVRRIADRMGADSRKGFECDLLVFSVEELIRRADEQGIKAVYHEELPK